MAREGYGTTYELRKQFTKHGTFAVFNKLRDEGELTDLQLTILENLIWEGSIFASYDSLMDFLVRKDFMTRERFMAPLKPDEK